MTIRIYLLLLSTLLACDGENTIREPAPDLPVIDIGAYDSDRAYFVYQIESDRSVDRDIYPRIVMTYRGHFENDRFRRFEFRTAKYGRIIAGLQEYHGAAHRTIDASMGWYTEFSGVELPFEEGERGIVTSVVVEISQLPPQAEWYIERPPIHRRRLHPDVHDAQKRSLIRSYRIPLRVCLKSTFVGCNQASG